MSKLTRDEASAIFGLLLETYYQLVDAIHMGFLNYRLWKKALFERDILHPAEPRLALNILKLADQDLHVVEGHCVACTANALPACAECIEGLPALPPIGLTWQLSCRQCCCAPVSHAKP